MADPDPMEWRYAECEGLISAQMHQKAPGWLIFRDGARGETLQQVATRADRVVSRVRAVDGDVGGFAEGHVLRVLVACWINPPPGAGQHFLLDPGTLCVPVTTRVCLPSGFGTAVFQVS